MSETVEVGQIRRLPSGEVCEVVEIHPGPPSPTAQVRTGERSQTVNVPWLEAHSVLVNPVEEGEG